MSGWDKITLFKFQQIDAINAKTDIGEQDKTLFSICIVFDMTEYELDNAGEIKAGKLIRRFTKIFSSPFEPKPYKKIGKYFINYDISKITFGQYVELAFFLSQKSPLHTAHYALASVSNKWLRKNNTKDHRKKADYFLTQPISKITGSLSAIIENYTEFNKEYKGLFGLDKEVSGDVQEDQFNKRHGWTYSASQVAEYERITLDQAYQLPVRQALNDLSYLKAKARYESEQINKH